MKLVLGLLLAAAVLITVLGYPKRYGALSARSRLFRTGGMGLVIVLLVVALAYAALPPLDGTRIVAFRHLSLMIVGVMLALSLACVALLDALESFSVLRREERAVLNRMVQEAAEARARTAQDSEAARLRNGRG